MFKWKQQTFELAGEMREQSRKIMQVKVNWVDIGEGETVNLPDIQKQFSSENTYFYVVLSVAVNAISMMVMVLISE